MQQRFRECIRLRNLAWQTEKSYTAWLRRFIEFVRLSDPTRLTERHLADFLTWLAVERSVSKATQRLAFSALLLFYRHVIEVPVTSLAEVVSSEKPRKLPVVLTRCEIERVFNYLNGEVLLASKLMYGCGLRLAECLSLRVKDFDFEKGMITVNSGKRDKDRVTILPKALAEPIHIRLERLRRQHDRDTLEGLPGVALPAALVA